MSHRLAHLLSVQVPEDTTRPRGPSSDKRLWQVHRTNAKMRGIEFKLTFEEWFCWWAESGHYSERGREVGKYVMSRKGDKGAYELGNIECVQAQVNSTAAHLGKTRSAETKARMSEAAKLMHANRKLHNTPR